MRVFLSVVTIAVVLASCACADAPAKVKLDVRDASIKDVAASLAQQSGASIVVDPKAEGKVTISLGEAELSQALDAITKLNNLRWRKMQFAKPEEGKVALEQLKSVALALAALPVTALAVEDPATKKSAVFAKDLSATPDTAGIALPTGYSWATIYAILPAEVKATETAADAGKVKSLSESQVRAITELAKMTPEERQQVFASEFLAQMSLAPEARQALARDRMTALRNLGPEYRDMMRQDMHTVMHETHPQDGQDDHPGGRRRDRQESQPQPQPQQ